MTRLIPVLILLAACVEPAPQRSTLPPGETAAAAPDEKETVVCTEETPTGDLIPRKVCRTEMIKQINHDDMVQGLQTPKCDQCGGGARIPGPHR